MQILIVEDEAKIRHFLHRGLLEESTATFWNFRMILIVINLETNTVI
jgi:DNA-binding response OmpR family regulator